MELQVKQLVSAIKLLAEEKNLPENIVHSIVEQAVAAAYRRDYGEREQDVRAQIDLNTSDVTIYVKKSVVESVVDSATEIELSAAKNIVKDVEIGDEVELTDKPSTFGRVAAQTAKQVIMQLLREEERQIIEAEYEDKIGTILSGVVTRVEARIIRVDLGKASGIMPASEQIPNESYTSGSRIKVYLKDVEKTNRGPQLILSRGSEEFVRNLFANEVPEMESGAVKIEKISREAGVRTKLAVSSSVPGVDPVGTFVGGHGTRVQAVTGEIGDREKIDIINFSEETKTFITNALSPTEVVKVEVDESAKAAKVFVNNDQLSIAIGRSGQNVRLASKLTGYELDIEEASGDMAVEQEAPAEEAKSQPTPKPVKKRLIGKQQLEGSLIDAIESNASEEEGEKETADNS